MTSSSTTSTARLRLRRVIAVGLASALIGTGLTFVASTAAHAAALDTSKRIVDSTGAAIIPVFTPSSGGVNNMPTQLQIPSGFSGTPTTGTFVAGGSTPVPLEAYGIASRTFIVKDANTHISVASRRLPSATEKNGLAFLNGADAVDLAGYPAWASDFNSLFGLLGSGTFPLVVTGDNIRASLGDGVRAANSIYYQTEITIDAQAKTWSIAPTTVEQKITTTTAVATSAVTATSATLTATVAPAAATGNVQFTQNGVDIPGAEAPVAGDNAIYGVSGLTPATAYTFGARYLGDATHEASTDDADPVTTLPVEAPADVKTTDLGVNVPTETTTEPSGLTIAVAPGAVTLTGPATRASGAEWQATGSLGDVTVNDDRRTAGAGVPWSLSGSASVFRNAASNEVGASNLGWKPSKVGEGAGTAGDEIAPGADGGLSSAKRLATGTGVDAQNVTTKVTAGLTLKVPAGSAGGDYTSILTLTLI